MMRKIGFIGAGHIAQYLVSGLVKADTKLELFLADPAEERTRNFASKFGCYYSSSNQDVVDRSELIILATRPEHVLPALIGLKFRKGQVLVSIAAGVTLETIASMVSPARAVRALPISCVSINKSPVLIFPENQAVREFFNMVGQVHVMPDEESMTPGTAVVGAFYAWMFPLMEEVSSWTSNQGIDPVQARTLVIETIEGACAVARDQDDMSLSDIWKTLATPGGISEQGAKVISENGAMESWSKALSAINDRMKGK